MKFVTVSEKGWIVIPKEIRERLGIKPGQKVGVRDTLEGVLVLVPVPEGDPIARGRGMLKEGPSEELSGTAGLLADRRWELEQEERDLPPPRMLHPQE